MTLVFDLVCGVVNVLYKHYNPWSRSSPYDTNVVGCACTRHEAIWVCAEIMPLIRTHFHHPVV